MGFIDAHAHLTSEESPELQAVLERAYKAGVSAIINVCTSAQDLLRGVALSDTQNIPKIYTVASCTPHDSAKEDPEFFIEIKRQIEAKKLIGIGEIGLDYHYDFAPKAVQHDVFRRYLELAKACNLPIVIHCREAFSDLISIIDEVHPEARVMLHCFTGTLQEAKIALHRGYYISLSGIVTFAKSSELQKVAEYLPDDLMFIETDSPFLAPQGHRGKKNEPAYLVETAKFVAALRGKSVESLATTTTQNVKRLFHGIS